MLLAMHSLRGAIEEVVYSGVLQLDERRFDAWLARTTPDFRYRITAHSPELRKDMTWLEHDRKGLEALFELLPKHHVNGAAWLRHAVLYTIERVSDDELRAVTSLSIYHTVIDTVDAHVEGGSSRLFAVGRYHDRFRLLNGDWLLAEREARLDTRQLGIGSHWIV